MQIVSNVALISINETLLVQLISFLIFVFIINRIMFRPLRESMEERERYIEGIRQDIGNSQKELETVVRQIREEDAAVRKASRQVTAELEKLGKQEANAIIASVRKEIVQSSNKARQEIDAQIVVARKSISDETGKLAVSIMERVLDRRLAS